jgi:hypothetical protein
LAAFEQNQAVTDLTINWIVNLRGAALGASLSSLMQNMTQLRRIHFSGDLRGAEGVRAFQPGLQVNRTLRELDLRMCFIRDDGVRLLADALDGNTTI